MRWLLIYYCTNITCRARCKSILDVSENQFIDCLRPTSAFGNDNSINAFELRNVMPQFPDVMASTCALNRWAEPRELSQTAAYLTTRFALTTTSTRIHTTFVSCVNLDTVRQTLTNV
jgi:hypothetical protein